MKRLFVSLFFLVVGLSVSRAQNQGVAIGDTQPKENAILYLKGNGSQALIIPIVNNRTTIAAPGAEKGMVVFDDSDKKLYYHNGTAWIVVDPGGSAGEVTGNEILDVITGRGLERSGAGTGASPFTVGLIPGTAEGQILKWNNTLQRWDLGTDEAGSAPTTDNTTIELSAGALRVKDAGISDQKISSVAPSKLTDAGAATGQVLKWNGTAWAPATDDTGANATPVLANGEILTGNGTTNTATTLSGDATLNNGTLTISNAAVTDTKVAAGISATKIAVTPSGNLAATNTQAALTELQTDIDSKDASTTNELQNLSTAGPAGSATPGETFEVNISNGTGVNIQEGTNISITQAANVLTISSDAAGSGTVTQVNAGTGLTGGPVTTTGTLSVDVGTGANQIPQLDGTGKLDPSVLPAGLGTVTQITAGTGLTGGPVTTTGTLSVDVGTGANQIPQLDGTGKLDPSVLPANIDSDATNDITSATSATGDVTGTFPSLTVTGIRGQAVGNIVPADQQVLKWNQANNRWEPAADIGSGTVTQINTGTGLTGGPLTTTGTIAVDAGTGANQIPQLDGTGKLPSSVLPSGVDINDANDLTNASTAGGDVSGAFSNLTVTAIQGNDVVTTAPSDQQVLKWNQTNNRWEPANDEQGSVATGNLTTTTTGLTITGGTNAVVGTGATINIQDATAAQKGLLTQTDYNTFNNKVDPTTPASGDLAGDFATGFEIAASAVGSAEIADDAVTVAELGTAGAADANKVFATDASGNPMLEDKANLLTGAVLSGSAAGGQLAGTYPNPSIATTAATGNTLITAVNNASAGTINTARLNAAVVLQTESPAAGDITGTFNGGLQIAANSITNTEINSAAGIAGSKINPAFTQNITTTGNISGVDASFSGDVDISGVQYDWPAANAAGVLQNDGTGALTWSSATGITEVQAGTGLAGGGTSSTVTLNLSNTAVTSGTYGDGTNVPQFTVDAQGRITNVVHVPFTPGMTNPMTTAGDLIIGGASGAAQTLPIGSNGQVLMVTGGAPAWQNLAGGGTITGVNTNAGSGLDGGGVSGTLDLKLMDGTSSGQILKWDGTQWTLDTDDVGGGGAPTLATGQLIVGNGTTNSAAGVSGDLTMNAGDFQIASGAVTTTEIANNTIANADISTGAAIAVSKLASGTNNQILQTISGIPTWSTITTGATDLNGLTDAIISSPSAGQVLVYNNSSSNFENRTLSGDIVSVSATGGVTIADGAISGGAGGKIADGTINTADLANSAVTNAKISGVNASKVNGIADGFVPRSAGAGGLVDGVIQDNGAEAGIKAAPVAGTTLYVGNSATQAAYIDGQVTVAGNVVMEGLEISKNLVTEGDPGVSGQVLTSKGPGLAPVWDDPAGITASDGLTLTGSNLTLGGQLGAGGASFFTTTTDNVFSLRSAAPALNTLVGINYKLADSYTGTHYDLAARKSDGTPNSGQSDFVLLKNFSTGGGNIEMFKVDNITSDFIINNAKTASAAFGNFVVANGNTGLGVTSPSEKLEVGGNVRFSGALMPNNLAGVAGQVLTSNGAGTSPTWQSIAAAASPANFVIRGNAAGTGQEASSIFDNGTRTGIGTSAPLSRLDVEGNIAIGANYSGTTAAPTNGAIIEGNVGIGTATPARKLHISEGTGSGGGAYNTFVSMIIEDNTQSFLEFNTTGFGGISFNDDAASLRAGMFFNYGTDELMFRTGSSDSRLVIDENGDVGIGTTAPANRLDVEGGAVIGSTYSGTNAAPANGLLVQGNVGIGTTTAASALTIGANKFQVDATAGDVTFTDDDASITFPVASTGNFPMINMFASGTSNTTRMVLAHSPAFPTYGLQYIDATDQFNFIGNGTSAMLIDLENTRVGIGTTSPSAELEVVGDVEIPAANEYKYATSKTKNFSLSAASFTTINNLAVDGTSTGNARWITGGTAGTADNMFATVNLPDGATITSVTLYCSDNDATYNINFTLVAFNMVGNSIQTLGTSTSTSGSPGISTVDLTGLSTVVDNSSRSYFIKVNTRQNNSNLWVRGAKVTYTITHAD